MDSPLNAAHRHAANADDYVVQGLLIPAAEEHYKAAESFRQCVEASNDDNTKRTLKMLYRALQGGKGAAEENCEATPATAVPLLPPSPASSPPLPAPNRMSDSQQTVDESFMLLGQRSDPGDAFNQFWKITEGMLEHLSQPVAFATAPLAPLDTKGPFVMGTLAVTQTLRTSPRG
ncbi:hypothetical protein A0H81_04532 [Grifola frondosa]|uniref:Uncharacterized protein n=1 Tax=Grifola frondosa TaxID=5627 RepID=A0A1C7MG87_GRIFR|nr:hypothetical protein A0H81_04532 [Grifola frondosa]